MKSIKERREALGCSREYLVTVTGGLVSVATIARIEAGTVTPNRSSIAAIEAALDRLEREREMCK